MIDATTHLVGVVGHPIAHSLSPAIHNAALAHDERNAVYLAFDVAPGRFRAFVDGMRAAGARGLNVTIPHKLAALEAADARSDEAERIGAANVLLFTGDSVVAHDTDTIGVRAALGDLGVSASGTSCLVIGAGGAAHAVVWALAELGASEVVVCNRSLERARALAVRAHHHGVAARVIEWPRLGEAVASARIAVNATSVGMGGEGGVLGDTDLAAGARGGLRAVLDLVYRTGETDLVRRARAHGVAAADGIGVLVHQAAEAYRLFWGSDAPVEVMRGAALRAAGRVHRTGEPS